MAKKSVLCHSRVGGNPEKAKLFELLILKFSVFLPFS